jgi:Xaa-Pro aminopeptidase
VKKRGAKAVLFHGPMERDEAARTGLETRSYSYYPMDDFLKECNGDRVQAGALRLKRMLADAGVSGGKLALYGLSDIGTAYPLYRTLERIAPELALDGNKTDILSLAMATKDAAEIDRIRKMGRITTSVVAKTADFLTHQRVKDDTLIGLDGKPVTVAKVKSLINLWLAEAGVENPEGCIFAIGRDAGVPHSTGIPEDALRLGQTIVFDIYPCEGGGGYFYDFTRTWCLGYAPDEVKKLYDQVYQVYHEVTGKLQANQPFSVAQRNTCELFEAMGHKTILNTPTTEEGYVHSIGHGLGLKIHEVPFSRLAATEEDKLLPGSVFTMEPGLYYPERGMGVRLEDSYWVNPSGKIEKLVDYPLELVLEMK